jgi:pimeloyl-ACP methyl ester carboxylesterase
MTISARFPAHTHRFAILFIHGLGGSAAETFGRWPDLARGDTEPLVNSPYPVTLSDDFDNYMADYPTQGTNFSIHEIGQALADEIEASSSPFRNYDMIWIVAHSLGGLVTHEAFETLEARHRPIYLRFLPGVLELGVPGNGSVFADFAEKLGPIIVSWLGYDPKLVAEVRTDSDYLETLNAHWADLIADRIRNDGWPLITCGYETRPESRVAGLLGLTGGEVVQKLYTSAVCPSGAQTPIPVSHMQLPKPQKVTDDSHKLLRRMIAEDLRGLAHRRYAQECGRTLFDCLTTMAVQSQPVPLDRETDIPLYKTKVTFLDQAGLTRHVTEPVLQGWSIEDAARRVVLAHSDCLQLSGSDNEIRIMAKPDAACR